MNIRAHAMLARTGARLATVTVARYAKDTGTGSRIGGGALSETSMCRQGNPKGLPSLTRILRKSKIT